MVLRCVVIVIFISLFSCQTQKKWTQKGIEKGWLDTTKKGSAMASILPDTMAKDSIIVTIVDTMVQIIAMDCPDLKPETRAMVKIAMDKKLNPSILKSVYRDTVIKDHGGAVISASFDSHGKLNLKVDYPQQTISDCEEVKKESFWRGIRIGFFGGALSTLILLVSVAVYLGRRKTR